MGLALLFGKLKDTIKLITDIDIKILIVWLEVNFLGQTILPELYTCLVVGWYVINIILWKLTLKTNQNGNRMVII
jgi:hypothetical protein